MQCYKEYIVYILQCADNSYYTGVTSKLEQRLWQHTTAVYPGCYTAKRRPVQLVYTAVFNDVYEAISWERRLKRWSRVKKEALIKGDWDTIHHVSYGNIKRSIVGVILEVRSSLDCARDDIGESPDDIEESSSAMVRLCSP